MTESDGSSPWMVIEVGGLGVESWDRWEARARDVARRLAPYARVVPVPVPPDEALEGPLRLVVNGSDVQPPHGGWRDPDDPDAAWPLEVAVLACTGVRGLLFLCVANSARSQLAEAIARRALPPSVVVQSAGSRPGSVHPLVLPALHEVGIDASEQRSKGLDAIDWSSVDVVITLCQEEICPAVDATRQIRWTFPDPDAEEGDETRRLGAFRAVRDGIAVRIERLAALVLVLAMLIGGGSSMV